MRRPFVIWRTLKCEHGQGSWAIIDGMVFVRTCNGHKATQIGGSNPEGLARMLIRVGRVPRLRVINFAVSSRSSGSVQPLRKRMSEKGSDPTPQGHPTAAPMGGLHQKSAFTQPVNYSGSRACSPAECDITQNSQITHVQIPLHPGAHQ